MNRIMLKSKIHRATVTDANIDYEGSITIDEDLMDAANLVQFEQVQVYDVTNGNRLETYVIPGERGSGVICLNGAAARLVRKGDIIIIASYVTMEEELVRKHQPSLVYVDRDNRIKNMKAPARAIAHQGLH
jgi:aspartate 1-decarboxylase